MDTFPVQEEATIFGFVGDLAMVATTKLPENVDVYARQIVRAEEPFQTEEKNEGAPS